MVKNLQHIKAISIHAPAKGATNAVLQKVISFADFNPRSREGSDRGSRRSLQLLVYFNPRSREGSDAVSG